MESYHQLDASSPGGSKSASRIVARVQNSDPSPGQPAVLQISLPILATVVATMRQHCAYDKTDMI